MLTDTAPHVERLMAENYRRMPPWRKLRLVSDAYDTARNLHAAGLRLREPANSQEAVNRDWAVRTLGNGPWIERMEFSSMSQPSEHVQAIKYAVSVLNDLNIRYAIGGSLASSLHGYSRYTQDAAIAVEPFSARRSCSPFDSRLANTTATSK
jgi:hypothetical protein